MAEIQKTLYRLPNQGKVAGVCAGLAEYFEFDVTIMRLIWAIAALFTGGFAILVYFVLAVILPVSDSGSSKAKVVNESIDDKFSRLGRDLHDNNVAGRARNYTGVGLILLGFWFLIDQMFPDFFDINWSYVWPVILIVIGLSIVIKRGK